MKIAYVLNSSDPFGGASKSFFTLLKGVVGAGNNALVVLPDTGGMKKEIERLGVTVACLNYRPNTYPYDSTLKDLLLWIPRLLARRYVNYLAYRRLSSMLKDVDIVHTNVSVIDIGARAARRCGIPHVYHFREYGDLDFSLHYFPSVHSFLRSVDYSICITRDIQRYHHLSSNGSSTVVYNGIAHRSDIMPVPDKDRTDYVLFVGRIEPTKGLSQLVEAYGKSGIDVPLWIAGEALSPRYMETLRLQIHGMGLDDRVVFLGVRTDLPQLMRNAHCVVVPSSCEAFGRVMPEAMFQGCLVIGRDSGGTHEQFENGLVYSGGEIGLRYTTTDELAELLRHMDSLADDGMRLRAFRTVNHFYSVESYVQDIITFYNRILS